MFFKAIILNVCEKDVFLLVGIYCRTKTPTPLFYFSILHKLAMFLKGKVTRGYWKTMCLIN